MAHKFYNSPKYSQLVRGRDSPILDIADVEKGVVADPQFFSSIWTDSAILDYSRDGTRFLLAHSSITEPAEYTVLIFIPEAEAGVCLPPPYCQLCSVSFGAHATHTFAYVCDGGAVKRVRDCGACAISFSTSGTSKRLLTARHWRQCLSWRPTLRRQRLRSLWRSWS